MTKNPRREIRELLDRIGRISAADEWEGDLNPTQRAALAYLARANRFSRSPSQVADFLAATRGTVSQTLKALARKGYVEEAAPGTDKRSISYEISQSGVDALERSSAIESALLRLSEPVAKDLATSLHILAGSILEVRQDRSFGLCKYCKHHRHGDANRHCVLLNVDLKPLEAEQICYEHESA